MSAVAVLIVSWVDDGDEMNASDFLCRKVIVIDVPGEVFVSNVGDTVTLRLFSDVQAGL